MLNHNNNTGNEPASHLEEDLKAGGCIHDDISQAKKSKIDLIISGVLSELKVGQFSNVSKRKLNRYYNVDDDESLTKTISNVTNDQIAK